MKIRVTPAALNDLKSIKTYIENDLSTPVAANNVVKRIIDDYSRRDYLKIIFDDIVFND